MTYLEKIKNFNESNIISLDECVLWALELFEQKPINKLDISWFKKPLIAWSWNALVTAKIVFESTNAMFCDESNFDDYISRDIDGLIILSASWEKHAWIFAQKAKDKWITTKLLTCNTWSTTEKIIWIENTIVTQKNREPYTYNTSTYLWWVLAYTWENVSQIRQHISEVIDECVSKINFSQYNWFILVTPDQFCWVNQLFDVKFKELFWRRIWRDICSYEQIKHAVTVVQYEEELCITFWEWELIYQWNTLHIPIYEWIWVWGMMAIGYYVIWNIQKSHPEYFKNNIGDYISQMNKTDFWKWLSVIVE